MNLKKTIFCLFLLIIFVFDINANPNFMDFKDIIGLSVQGEIKADSKFGIRFKKDIKVDINKTDFFKMSPNTPVVYELNDNNTILFTPDDTLYPDRKYFLEIDLNKLFPDERFKDNIFKVSFLTRKRQLKVQKIIDLEKDDSRYYSLKMILRSDIPIEYGAVKKDDFKLLRDDDSGKEYKRLDKVEVKDKDIIVFTGKIKRSERSALDLKLYIDNKNLGIRRGWQHKIIVPMYQSLDIISYKAGISNGSNRIEIDFNRVLKSDQEDLIRLNSDIKYITSIYNKKVSIIGDFKPGNKYSVSLSGLIKAKNGESLGKDRTLDLVFDNIDPQIRFESEGIYLPLGNKKGIRFQTINVSSVKIRLERLYENNLTYFLYENSLKSDNKYYYGMYRYGEKIFEKEIPIKADLNSWKDAEIDLSKYMKDKSGILYKVNILFSDSQKKMSMVKKYSYGQIDKIVIPTDLGMCVKKAGKASYIFVFDMKDNSPAKGAKVCLYDEKNQLVDWGITDEDGLYISRYKQFLYATAYCGEKGLSFIKPADNKLEYSSFDLVNKVKDDENNVYIFTDRDVYRPGDDINIGFIFRNSYDSFPIDHPVNVVIKDPLSKVVEKTVLKRSRDGFYFYTFKSSDMAPTGVWNMNVDTGQSQIDYRLRIESIVPTRLEVKIDSIEERLEPGSKRKVYVSSKYLTGKSANDLRSSLTGSIYSTNMRFKGYSQYGFNDDTIPAVKYSLGDLDLIEKVKDGYEYLLQLPQQLTEDLPLKGELVAKVYDDNGRDTDDSIDFKIKGKGLYSGILKPQSNFLESGKEQNTSIVLLDSDARPVRGKKIRYRIFRNESYWWWHYSTKHEFRKHFMSSDDLVLETEGILISEDKPVSLKFTPSSRGEYLILVDSPDNSFYSSSCFFSAFRWGNQMSDKESFYLKITAEKDRYHAGDVARLLFESPFSGKALVTLEGAGKVFNKRWINVNDGKNVVNISLTNSMFPNVFVFISFLPEFKKNIEIPSRIFGICQIPVTDQGRSLTYTIKSPDKVKPGEKVRIEVDTLENIQSQLVINIADEGLLLITDYSSPAPERFFNRKKGIGVETSDIFNRFIQPTAGNSVASLSVGGGENQDLRKKNINRIASERFSPVQISSGILTTDKNGKAIYEFVMPDYEGSVRVSVAGARGKRYGSIKKNIKVFRDISIFAGLPRFLYVNDKSVIPIRIINNQDKELNISLEVKADSGSLITYEDDKKTKLVKERLFNLNLKAPDKAGEVELVIEIGFDNRKIRRSFKISVIDPAPYMMIKEYFDLKKNEVFDVKASDLKNGYIEISTVDGIDLYSNISSLLKYPYGCLEQTISKAFPQMYLDKDYIQDDILKKKASENVVQTLKRLKYFQKSSGAFSYWPENSHIWEFANLYTGLFLHVANEKGYYVDSTMFSKWIEDELNKSRQQKGDMFEKTFRLYILSSIGKDVLSEANYLMQNDKERLDTISLLFLIRTYRNLGQQSISESMLGENIGRLLVPDDNKKYDTKDLAMMLECYVDLGYKQRAFKVFRKILLSQKLSEERSTLERALLLKSTLNYINQFKDKYLNIDLIGDNNESIRINDRKFYRIEDNKMENIHSIKNNSDDVISIGVYSLKKRDDKDILSSGLRIQRRFTDINGENIEPESIRSGDEFYMYLKVENLISSDQQNLLLQQKIPACWEFVQDIYQKKDKVVRKSSEFDYRDKRDDSVTWFFDIAKKQDKQFIIKMRSINKGEYTLPGVFAQNMYQTEIFYRGISDKINVYK